MLSAPYVAQVSFSLATLIVCGQSLPVFDIGLTFNDRLPFTGQGK
jgi:hypothetical protein